MEETLHHSNEREELRSKEPAHCAERHEEVIAQSTEEVSEAPRAEEVARAQGWLKEWSRLADELERQEVSDEDSADAASEEQPVL